MRFLATALGAAVGLSYAGGPAAAAPRPRRHAKTSAAAMPLRGGNLPPAAAPSPASSAAAAAMPLHGGNPAAAAPSPANSAAAAAMPIRGGNPAAAAPSPTGSAVAAMPLPGGSPSPTLSGSPTPAIPAALAGPDSAAAPVGSAVFFTVEGSPEHGPLTLIPLHCYDARQKARLVGDACLPLLPAGATVQTSGGPLQVGEAVTPQCPRQPLMGGRRLSGKVKAVPFLYGAWPSLQAVRYAEVPEHNLGGAMAPIETMARHAITAATALPVADLSIYQIIALSLATDRKIQKIYSVVVPDHRGHTQWSGLLIGDPQSRAATVAGDEQLPDVKQHSMQIVGHLDIDHDGKLELLVNTGGTNLDRYSVRVFDGAKLPVVSYWHSCN